VSTTDDTAAYLRALAWSGLRRLGEEGRAIALLLDAAAQIDQGEPVDLTLTQLAEHGLPAPYDARVGEALAELDVVEIPASRSA
jgi:hypothetical protein